MSKSGSLNFEEIRKLLPQGYPLLMIDRVLELEPGRRIVALKNVTGNESFFQGHFPGLAIMPAALILEGLAQAAIVLVKRGRRTKKDDGSVFLFGSVHARMHRPVFPGDALRLEVKLLKDFDTGGAAEGRALVGSQVCAEVEMYFSRVRRDEILRNRPA